MTFATLALAALFAGQAPASQAPPTSAPAAPTKVVPMAVQVQAASGDAAVRTWAKELRAALEARQDEFRPARPGEKPEFVVRIDSVGKEQDGTPVMNGALILGKTTKPFNYTFKDVRVEAEKLARNLRKYAEQMKAAPASR
jgi:hypothetical protein